MLAVCVLLVCGHLNITVISFVQFTTKCVIIFIPQVGAQSLHTGIKGAYYNVCINLKQVKDEAYCTKITSEVESIVKESEENCSKVMEILASRDK